MTSTAIPQETGAVQRLWLFASGLGLALAVVAAFSLWHLREEAIQGQSRELGLLSLALTDEIDRGLQGTKEGLQAMRSELRDGLLPVKGPDAGRALLTRAELMPLIRTLWLIDRHGRLLNGSDATRAPAVSTFAPALDGLAEDGIAVSGPFMDTIRNQSLVALAVRFAAPEAAGGWVIAAMPATALLGAFHAASPAPDARMAVYRSDGARLAGSIDAAATGEEATRSPRLAAPRRVEQRRFEDGSDRLVAVHDLPHFGMTVVLTRNLDAVLLPWHEAARLTAAGMVILLAIMAGAVVLVERADRRHAKSQLALQAQRSRASKLESLGTLAGGVAHDFNNVLAGIVGYGEMARDEAVPDSHQARHLDNVLNAALRGKTLVERILAFSRGGAHATIVFELEPIVEEVLTVLGGALRPGLVLERALGARGARVRGDPAQAFEAVMNLCTNAMQAMPRGGMVSVHLERVHVPVPRVLSHSQMAAADYVALAVTDQGGGITPEVMEHLFEPFFTTRGAESGTGLGLAVVHGVVTEFGGAIDVQSEPGHGARFTLYLPECADAVAAPASTPMPLPRGDGRTVLVVDDEPALVALTEEWLRDLGYAPVGYSDPEAALSALRATPRRFAAVLTDEVMPGLSGTALTAAVRTFAPALPVLLISGFGGALLTSRAAAAGVTRVLAKPLQRAELARAVAELLR